MKKIFLKLLIFFAFINVNFACFADVLPYYINSLRRYGIGYTSVTSPLVMRKLPTTQGKITETLNFDFKTGKTSCLINKDRCTQDEAFAVFSTSKKIALLTAMDESENWSLVCFNQTEAPICGWIQENEYNVFYNWTDFFNIFGKKYGVYLFKDLNKNDKILYAAPVKQTNTTGSIELPRMIMPWLIRGNWLLVKVYDFNKQMKTGWINFRGNDGKLKLFVKF